MPIEGLAADRQLAPEYPGISGADSLADWDPPFPIDLSRIRPQDERYWTEFRTTPKAFVPYERGRDLWSTQFGRATSIRMVVPGGTDVGSVAGPLAQELERTLDPAAMGMAMIPTRQLALAASGGATDFGEYFTYFSFFLVVSALLLAVMFFRLGVEQRLRQIGILRASGFTIGHVRQLLLTEAGALALVGSAVGVVGAIAYAHVIVYGAAHVVDRGSRNDFAGGPRSPAHPARRRRGRNRRGAGLRLARAPHSGEAVAAVIARGPVARRQRGRGVDAVLTATGRDRILRRGRAARRRRIRMAFASGGLVLWRWRAPPHGEPHVLRRLAAIAPRHCRRGVVVPGAISRLGFRGAAFRPVRSVLVAALIASAAFIIVAVDAFRRGGGELTNDPKAGTGGFALLARAEVPVVYNPNEPGGRSDLQLDADPELADVRFMRFRLRPGDDASCLNLYRPASPTLIAPEPAFVEANRFSFAGTLATTDDERANPWRLLDRRFEDGAVPAIADATSLQYVLHAAVGDDLSIDVGGSAPLVLRFVAALRDSVLQSEIVIGEAAFVRLFPSQQGFRFFLVDAPRVRTPEQVSVLAQSVEKTLAPFGVDAVGTVERLDSFHRVENTYLSTFQALGALGLLLGTVGLATVMFRNVLERRREMALLRAVGYNGASRDGDDDG